MIVFTPQSYGANTIRKSNVEFPNRVEKLKGYTMYGVYISFTEMNISSQFDKLSILKDTTTK